MQKIILLLGIIIIKKIRNLIFNLKSLLFYVLKFLKILILYQFYLLNFS